jgi:hypothetical protein
MPNFDPRLSFDKYGEQEEYSILVIKEQELEVSLTAHLSDFGLCAGEGRRVEVTHQGRPSSSTVR